MTSSLLIRNGLVVNSDGCISADLLVEGEVITKIADKISPRHGTPEVDARGKQVLPAGIDPHVHLSPFIDDFVTGTQAALAGGITTIGVMCFPSDKESIGEMLAHTSEQAERYATNDVILHSVINIHSSPTPEALTEIRRDGQTTCKMFTMLGNFDSEVASYVDLLAAAKNLNVLPLFHCEDQGVMLESARMLRAHEQSGLEYYEKSRPILSEELAVQKVIALCELTECPVYIVHVSSKRALDACSMARARGLPVYVETRPIYLHFDAHMYQTPDAALFVSFPPIRTHADGDALWHGLADGTVHAVGSDHAPLLRSDKTDHTHCCIDNPRPGMGNVQEMLPVLYSEGVLKGRLSLEQFVRVTSANCAKLLGLYPQKGVIAVGADADINIWDPEESRTIRTEDGYSRTDFSLYDGWSVKGGPEMTIRRGAIVCRGGKVTAVAGSGRLLRRIACVPSLAT